MLNAEFEREDAREGIFRGAKPIARNAGYDDLPEPMMIAMNTIIPICFLLIFNVFSTLFVNSPTGDIPFLFFARGIYF